MYCRKCGKEIAGQSKFCQYCGASLISENKTNNTGEDYEQPASNIPKSVGKSSMWKLIAGAAVLVLTIVVGAVIISKISKNNSDTADEGVKTEKESSSSGLFAGSKWKDKITILQDFYNSEFEEKAMKDITTYDYEQEESIKNFDLAGRIYVWNGEPVLAVADVHDPIYFDENESDVDVKLYNVVDGKVNSLFSLDNQKTSDNCNIYIFEVEDKLCVANAFYSILHEDDGEEWEADTPIYCIDDSGISAYELEYKWDLGRYEVKKKGTGGEVENEAFNNGLHSLMNILLDGDGWWYYGYGITNHFWVDEGYYYLGLNGNRFSTYLDYLKEHPFSENVECQIDYVTWCSDNSSIVLWGSGEAYPDFVGPYDILYVKDGEIYFYMDYSTRIMLNDVYVDEEMIEEGIQEARESIPYDKAFYHVASGNSYEQNLFGYDVYEYDPYSEEDDWD